jgi:hypothetical protein
MSWCRYEETIIRQSETWRSGAMPGESFNFHSGVHGSREGMVI